MQDKTMTHCTSSPRLPAAVLCLLAAAFSAGCGGGGSGGAAAAAAVPAGVILVEGTVTAVDDRGALTVAGQRVETRLTPLPPVVGVGSPLWIEARRENGVLVATSLSVEPDDFPRE